MAIDPQRIGTMAMGFIESLEQKYGDEARIQALAFIAAVDHGHEVTIEYRFADGEGAALPLHVGRGLLVEVDRGLTR